MKKQDFPIVLRIEHLSQCYEGKWVLWDLDLQVISGQCLALVGPSGAGKSTVLRMVLGVEKPTEGKVVVCGEDGEEHVVSRPSSDRGIILQRYSLFPDKTALQNVALGLMFLESELPYRAMRFLPLKKGSRGIVSWSNLRKIHLREAAALLERMGLKEHMHKYPHQLSGGGLQALQTIEPEVSRSRIERSVRKPPSTQGVLI